MTRFVTLPSGLRIEYHEQGRRGPTPLVFLHGVTDSWRSFEPVLALLPVSLHAIALSFRGHGESSKPESGYRYADLAADVARLLDTLGLRRAVVVGHSMGAMVAHRFAVDYPTQTAGLVLAGSFASLWRHPQIGMFYESTIAVLTDPIDAAFAREWQVSNLARPIDPLFLDTAVAETLKVPARVWKATFGGFLDTPDCLPELTQLRVPTLLAWGDRDTYATRTDQDQLLAALPGATLRSYDGAGHALHWEDPATFTADLVDWYREEFAGEQR